jgi:hypothetical protein
MAGIVRITYQQNRAKYLVVHEDSVWIKDRAEFEDLKEAKIYAEELSKKYKDPIAVIVQN